MLIRIGLENGMEGKSISWVFEYPGCFAYGKEGSEAILKTPQAVVAYQQWIGDHTQESWLNGLGDFDVRLEEAFECYNVDEKFELAVDGTEINAWFKHDAKSLSKMDVEQGIKILSWSRMDLLSTVSLLTEKQMDQGFPGEQWSIRGILKHIANAEWWYLDRLSLIGDLKTPLPIDVFERLEVVRSQMNRVLPEIIDFIQVKDIAGEKWSPRKILRRAAWHEKDHILHLERLLTYL